VSSSEACICLSATSFASPVASWLRYSSNLMASD
jgi:hypothetical protein